MPHSLVRGEGRLDVSGGVRLRGEGARFAADLGFLPLVRKGAALSVEFGAKAAARRGVKPLSGAYALRIDGSGIALTGYDERGAFYAVQTLRQIAESPAAAGGLPYLDNTDTVFGQVYAGMDVVDQIACVPTVKNEDETDTYRPQEDSTVTIYKVTIDNYPGPSADDTADSAASDSGAQ